MKNSVGEVLALFVSDVSQSDRVQKDKIHLDSNGIVGDKFYGKDIYRSVLLTSIESYKLALKHEIEMDYGMLGENILIDYNPYYMASGKRIKVGTVILEVTQNCTICTHLSSIDKKLPKLLSDDRGIFVKVIDGGIIKKGDKLLLVD